MSTADQDTVPTMVSNELGTARQLRLFRLAGTLTVRFGSEFFRGLPRSPGVYFFHDADGRLLYIGQSSDLRVRLDSYRHFSLDRHPRRT